MKCLLNSSGRWRIVWRPLALLVLSAAPLISQDQVETLLREHQQEISTAARQFRISARLLASVVFAERSLNVKPGELIVDYVLAKSGYNSSLGMAQVKVNTAEWIEEQLHNPDSEFYLGEASSRVIPAARSESERIERLNDASWNLLYAAAYVAMIKKQWSSIFLTSPHPTIQTGVIATVYSLGISRPDGSIRIPHNHPQLNQFGKTAQEFFDSFRMRIEFPNESSGPNR